MPARTWNAAVYVTGNALLWLGALPAALIVESEAVGVPVRGWLQFGFAVVVALGGIALVDAGARVLSAAGVQPFGVTPGAELVIDGVYSRVRNPIELGVTAMSIAPWLAIEVELMWAIPVATFAWLAVGVGPYEDRRLLETFGEDFESYRSSVRKWVPRRG